MDLLGPTDRRSGSRRVGRTRGGLSLGGPALHRAGPTLGGAGRLVRGPFTALASILDRPRRSPLVGAPAGGLSPAEIDAFAAAGDYAAISKPNLSPILGRYYERSWSHGEGHTLYDSDGRGFLDFACGIATTSLGHHHPAVTAAIKDQADKLLHICNALGYLEPVGRLAAMLADACPAPLDTVFFGNSGAEAVS